ncbi:NAD-dependent epimerase/dehydratase family protein [Streptomyces sp. NPDC058286]|uniref:NAD-dependent epimerase/dehydratase family protein n=1 Tax=Streptomyces sp. NPDC058286 TaxID=3346422 RepID=UPI0036EDA77A
MRIVVTGHKGYIGAVLVGMLISAGHQVRGLDIGLFDNAWCGPRVPEPRGMFLDIRDTEAEHFADTDAVIHLAALSNDSLGAMDPQLTNEVNYQASVRLASAAKEAGVERFLFSSSCSIYGFNEEEPRTENSETFPLTEYAKSKVETERSLSILACSTFAPTFLRNATVYGFSPRLRTDLVVNQLTATALVEKEIELKSDGSAWRPFIHVEDVARAFVSLLEAPISIVGNQIYNVGIDGQNFRVRDIAEILSEEVLDARVVVSPFASTDHRSYKVSFAKLTREVPSFKPQWTVRDGIRQLIDEFSRNTIQFPQLTGSTFHRLDSLMEGIERGKFRRDLRPLAD